MRARRVCLAVLVGVGLTAARVMGGAATNTTGTAEAIPAGQKVRLAVGSLGLSEVGSRELGDVLAVALGKEADLGLVDRQSLDRVLSEQQMSLAGLVRAKDAVRVGRLLRADWFLLGSAVVAGGGTSVVARVVDARTGVMRDVGIFDAGKGVLGLSEQLAGFVRGSRRGADAARPAVYLAMGVLEDLGANNRLADLPAQLRKSVALASRDWNVSLVERECLSALANEVRLDLAGLTEQSGAAPAFRLQPAFWLVDGYYQSYETTKVEVELVLRVHRIFGRTKTATVKAAPGQEVEAQALRFVSSVIAGTDEEVMFPSRTSEAKAQMTAVRDLLEGRDQGRYRYSTWQMSESELRKLRRNLQEAIQSLEVVLLLDVGDREARLRLATCLADPAIRRFEEGRELLRGLIDEDLADRWGTQARDALEGISQDHLSPAERTRWFQSAAQTATRPAARVFYNDLAREAAVRPGTKRGVASTDAGVRRLLEEQLDADIQLYLDGLYKRTNIITSPLSPFQRFSGSYGTNKAAAADHLAALLPGLKEKFPDLAPFHLAFVLVQQTRTNVALLKEFTDLLERLEEHPAEVPTRPEFWQEIGAAVSNWGYQRGLPEVSARVLKNCLRSPEWGGSSRRKYEVRLGYAYLGLERWRDALACFEALGPQPVDMGGDGPWGTGWGWLVVPGWEANGCRRKLGLEPVWDRREFGLGNPGLRVRSRDSVPMAAEGSSLWMVDDGVLKKIDSELKEQVSVPLPFDASVTVLGTGPEGLWIGTDGQGLFEYRKTEKRFRQWAVKDGLFMDGITALLLTGDTLWIGYGSTSGGGLGCLDTRTGAITSFSRSVSQGVDETRSWSLSKQEPFEAPTRRKVQSLAAGADGDIWMDDGSGLSLRRYQSRSQKWDGDATVRSWFGIAASSDRLFAAGVRGVVHEKGLLGVSAMTFRDGTWKNLPATEGLPAREVRSLAVVDGQLWIGGVGYLERVDPVSEAVNAVAYVRARAVKSMVPGESCLWVLADRQLYRVRLGGRK